MLKRSPIHPLYEQLGARLVPFAGWEMPIQFSGISEEHRAVRERVGLFDVSHMGQIEVSGKGALSLLNWLVTGDLWQTADGQALYTCACNEQGTIKDDLIVYRRTAKEALVVCNASNREKVAAHFALHQRPDARVRDASEEYALLALQGPKAFDLLAEAGASQDLSALRSFHFQDAVVAGIACTVARTGYTGEDGVELFVGPDRAEQLYSRLLESGSRFGILPIGLGARDTLRLEARLSLYGNEIDETTNPIEAGLGWIVKLEKPEFIGKAAIERIATEGPERKLVGFEMTGRGIARHGYPLLDLQGNAVGICTSGGPAPTLGKSIGLGYLPRALTTVGTEFRVDCRGKPIDARVVRTPFYKRPR